jgi:hypothetical protein
MNPVSLLQYKFSVPLNVPATTDVRGLEPNG